MDEASPRRQRLVIVWVVLGLALACVPAFASSFMICGISGCSGGGFGRATDPDATIALLITTGVVAAFPAAIHALVQRSPRLLAAAVAVGVVTTVVTGLVIGSDFQGCPRNAGTTTCLEEADP